MDNSHLRVRSCDLADAAHHAYSPENFTINGVTWNFVGETHVNGIRASTFINAQKKTQIVAFRGNTYEVFKGNTIDAFNVGNFIAEQTGRIKTAAVQLVKEQQAKRPDYAVAVTGHSLGGIVAQAAAGQLNISGAGFNTFCSPALRRDTFRYDRVEFYVHNTHFAGQEFNRDQCLGKFVQHKGSNHAIKPFVKGHFQEGCAETKAECTAREPTKNFDYYFERGLNDHADVVSECVRISTQTTKKALDTLAKAEKDVRDTLAKAETDARDTLAKAEKDMHDTLAKAKKDGLNAAGKAAAAFHKIFK